MLTLEQVYGAITYYLSHKDEIDSYLKKAEPVTHDRKTIPHYFAEFILSETSPGVLIVPQKLPVANVVTDLILIWTASEAEEWTNRIRSLPI